MTNKYGFKGWDWSELASVLLTEPWSAEDVKPLQEFIGDIYSKNYDEAIKTEELCRNYLQAIIDNFPKDAYVPLWKGLLAIEHHGAFLQMYSYLVGHMWT